MIYIEPNSTVDFLENVPFDSTYENTMFFPSVAEQTAYFNTKVQYTFSNNSYQRAGLGVLKVGWIADGVNRGSLINALYKCGYMRFKNTNYENKWFYAFVDKVGYVNNNTVEVAYHLDIIQTWLFDFSFNECFIERTHVSDDTIGANTIPENLEIGTYKSVGLNFFNENTPDVNQFLNYRYTPIIVMATSFDNTGSYAPGGIIKGHNLNSQGDMFSGIHYFSYPMTTEGVSTLNNDIETAVNNALSDGILGIFMCPAISFDGGSNPVNLGENIFINKPANIDGYTPRNKKLLCYPYNMLYVTNNQGNIAEYLWEEFRELVGNNAVFNIWGNFSMCPGLSCTPMNYKGVFSYNYDEQLTLGGFPLCSWTNDAYKAWLAQNTGAILSNVFSGAVGAITASYTNPVAAVGNLLSMTANAIGTLRDQMVKPPQSSGNNNGNLQYQQGVMTFSFYQKYIKQEYAKVIDAYFDMYGYKVNKVDKPNLAVRSCYTYVKTIGCSLQTNLPTEDTAALEKIFDKGIRFWTTGATYGVYNPAVNDNTRGYSNG